MKELQNLVQDKVEVREEAPKESKQVQVGRILPGDGHTVWECRVETMEINKAEYELFAYFGPTHLAPPMKVITKPGYIYCSALNRKNAERKFKKRITELLDIITKNKK